MTLLTTEEYKAIAASLTFPTEAFIDGHFCPAKSGKTFDTVNPATGAVLAKIAMLVFIILFIQKRPRGLFALKGRAVEN